MLFFGFIKNTVRPKGNRFLIKKLSERGWDERFDLFRRFITSFHLVLIQSAWVPDCNRNPLLCRTLTNKICSAGSCCTCSHNYPKLIRVLGCYPSTSRNAKGRLCRSMPQWITRNYHKFLFWLRCPMSDFYHLISSMKLLLKVQGKNPRNKKT